MPISYYIVAIITHFSLPYNQLSKQSNSGIIMSGYLLWISLHVCFISIELYYFILCKLFNIHFYLFWLMLMVGFQITMAL